MSYFRLTLGLMLSLVVAYGLPNSAKAQPESSVNKEEFLRLYREALPKLEVALFRNKSIEAELTSYNPLDKSEKSVWRRKMTYRSNHDRFILSVTTSKPEVTTVRILRPDHLYVLGKSSSSPYLTSTDRTIPENASESLTSIAWWNHPQVQAGNGVGHGLISNDEDWHTNLTNDSVSINSVTETNDSGRKCYRVAVVYVKDNIHSSGTVYFDKASFMVFHITVDRQLSDGSHLYVEQMLDFDMSPGDFDSIVLKNHKIYSENKQLKLSRYLSEEHAFSVYNTLPAK